MKSRVAPAAAGACLAGRALGLHRPRAQPIIPASRALASPSWALNSSVPSVVMARLVRDGGHAPPRPGEVRAMMIPQLGNFSYDPTHGGGVPADVVRLDGMTVRLIGFMVPPDEAQRVTRFDLVPSIGTCCLGQPPAVQHRVLVTCAPGRPVAYSPDPVVVEGRLAVREVRDVDYVVSLFQVSDPTVAAAGEQPPDLAEKDRARQRRAGLTIRRLGWPFA